MVLEFLLQDGCSLAGFATVSREWQTIIERHNFSRIKVTSSRAADFGSMVHRNRSFVRYIWFCVELDEYDCTTGKPDRELPAPSKASNAFVTTAFLDLFSALSVWEPGSSLLLDISFSFPSDPEHRFKYLTFEPDNASDMSGRDQQAEQSILVKAGDQHHGWNPGSRNSVLTYEADRARQRRSPVVAATAIDPGSNKCAPPSTDAPTMVPDHVGMDVGPYAWTAGNSLRALEAMVRYMSAVDRQIYESVAIREPSSRVSRAVANASLTLEHLSASFIADAGQFFDARQPSWQWPNLTWLALTSQVLVPQGHPTELDDMLRAAAAAAMKMPNLETMEIWNGIKGLAMLFKYQRAERGRPAVITWRGTWELTLRPLVLQAWDSVVLSHGGEGHVVVKELLVAGTCIKSHADAICQLKLSRPVIRSVSLRQIQTEQEFHEGVQGE
ncbi:hypothetical protein PVAG01_08463 [Phlyctema vagabunda]|uniref:DUF6546 domain-containing protein n=1 Tax=Phlyctema vagabunda TaxID=108571 RepID=A0ABR4P9H0_9HELO